MWVTLQYSNDKTAFKLVLYKLCADTCTKSFFIRKPWLADFSNTCLQEANTNEKFYPPFIFLVNICHVYFNTFLVLVHVWKIKKKTSTLWINKNCKQLKKIFPSIKQSKNCCQQTEQILVNQVSNLPP